MGFLQPWMLWALPAVLLPLIIHLLNRLRYKTVHWAAMIFLLNANRAATRRAKIRQHLLLLCRMLVILFLIWAMSRPLVGGWLGSAAGGAPETVLILLDRSASMESRGLQPQSKRIHALSLLAQAAKQSAGSHFVLLENVLRQPLDIADASTLAGIQMAEATDTAADLPAMVRAAVDYLIKNKPGSAEIWIASDLQSSNWRPESAEWQDLNARMGGLPQSVRVRIIDLSSPAGDNVAVSVKAADLRVRDPLAGKTQLSLALELKAAAARKAPVPLLITRDGAKSQNDVAINSPLQRQSLKFELNSAAGGWGQIELPADDNSTDNTAWFVYAPPANMRTAVIGQGPAAQRLRFAAAPDKTRTDRIAEVVAPAGFEKLNLKETALIVWTAPTPSAATAKALQSWVESGGVLLAFPAGAESGAGPLGVTWNAVENAPAKAPFRVATWDELDGPLARTDSGADLPLARLEIGRRQVPVTPEAGHVYATFADGRPFLVSRKVGAGQVFACATLPDDEWSSFGEGLVMLPMIQRLLDLGGQHLSPATLGLAGEWKPSDPEETWTPIEPEQRRDWRWRAGVYQSGARKIALNRPESEDSAETVPPGRLPDLLRSARVSVLTGAVDQKADSLQSEIWSAMVVVTMLLMCMEMVLAMSKGMLPGRPAQPAGPGSTPAPKPTQAAV